MYCDACIVTRLASIRFLGDGVLGDSMTRRQWTATIVGGLGVGALSGCGRPSSLSAVAVAVERAADDHSPHGSGAWEYRPLEPSEITKIAYHIYPDGGCMYAIVGSVIGQLAERYGEPFASFPFEMMRYGDGGVGGYGSLCGVVNGAAALIGLFHREKGKEAREAIVTEFCSWYETTALPSFVPEKPQWADEVAASVAGSVLCHVSVAKWQKASGFEAYSTEKKERCRRLAADGAAKIVELLNRRCVDPKCDFAPVRAEVKACIDCHGPRELGDAMGKMQCSVCHDFGGATHPTTKSMTSIAR